MKELRTFIETFAGKMYLVGPCGNEIHLSPGSEVHDLEESAAGHLMLPCSRVGRQHQLHTEDSQVFTVGEFFLARPESSPQEVSLSPQGLNRQRERATAAAARRTMGDTASASRSAGRPSTRPSRRCSQQRESTLEGQGARRRPAARPPPSGRPPDSEYGQYEDAVVERRTEGAAAVVMHHIPN